MKKSKAIVILIVILGALAGLAYYASIILSSTGIGEEMSIPLGLDLSGGVSITYQVVDDNPSAEDMSDTIYKLQKRVEGYSTEASVYQVGDDRITVEIPGVSDANAILEDLGNPGSLEFQLPDGTVYMTGDQVADAQAGTTTDSYGNKQYVVQLKLTDDGAKLFADATTDNVGNYLPIVYDGETISYPQVKEAITGGTAQISGMKTYEDAETLATQIRIGSLDVYKRQEIESGRRDAAEWRTRLLRMEECMDLVNIRDLFRSKDEYLDTTVTIGGWVRSLRNSKNFGFIVVNDGTFFEPVQVVFSNVLENFEEVEKLNVGAAIIVTGKLVATPEMKQPFEIQAEKIEVEGASTPDYPLQKKKHSFEYLRTISHLRPRTNTFEAVFRVRSLIAYAIHKFFQERDFVYVHTPLITGSDCEGAGEMFQVTTMDLANVPKNPDGTVDYTKDFFNKPTNLTVSGQLNGETYAMAFKNIYTFGPTFRAENSNTTRHAAEFWMIEPEIAFADLEDDMILAESMLKYIIRYVLENAPEEMAFFNNFIDKGLLDRLNNVVNSDFARVTYTEAIEILEKHNDKFEYKVSWGADLQTEHERYLTEEIYKRPVFVTDYPKEIKAFYMKMNEDGKTVAAVDCLVPGIGEIIGGSQREDDYDKLLARINELGLREEDYEFYLDLRKYGSARHAGFGLGFERCVMYLTGMSNIRDVIPFPRTVNNCEL